MNTDPVLNGSGTPMARTSRCVDDQDTVSDDRRQDFRPVHLTIDCVQNQESVQPVSFGIPVPKGTLWRTEGLALHDPDGKSTSTQCEVLARWSDGSVKWLFIDAMIDPLRVGRTHRYLRSQEAELRRDGRVVQSVRKPDRFDIDTGTVQFSIARRSRNLLEGIEIGGLPILHEPMSFALNDSAGRRVNPRIESVELVAEGPVRTTIRFRGRFSGRAACRFEISLSFFAGTGLVRIRWSLHNPRRARHRGGLWDLGDPGSILFRDFSFSLGVAGSEGGRIAWRTAPDQPLQVSDLADLEIYQDSSGGDNWRSPNHVNHQGRVPVTFRGYRTRVGGRTDSGLRANPVVAVAREAVTMTAAIPEFWEQFPNAVEISDRFIRVRPFPKQFGDLYELQGGERKTHEFWIHVGTGEAPSTIELEWVHRPARVRAMPECYATSGAIPFFRSPSVKDDGRLDGYLEAAIDQRCGLVARREIIDEFGWRNFGEVYADHEQEYFEGNRPAISHYNNQYDMILGMIIQDLRTGDPRWSALFDPLARHVMDIDIYHTNKDRSAYNGGLFWFTDHYMTASTSTHRTYSRNNCKPEDRSYGGGPSSSHLFTSGLLLYYYMTGDYYAREAVVELADWVIQMDNGRKTILGLIDHGPTGLASFTGTMDYHGPGRGGGNSINALLDGWLATGERSYLEFAETLVRRCIHPLDNINSLGLVKAEKRWSYTVFLVSIEKYLCVKNELNEIDEMYKYARASLISYVRWMLKHEQPYFDSREELDYPTETWPAQDFRKANVMRMAAAYVEEPTRSRLIDRASELSERAWSDLLSFDDDHSASARALALMMVEGFLDASYQDVGPSPCPCHNESMQDFGLPRSFVAQKERVRRRLGLKRTN